MRIYRSIIRRKKIWILGLMLVIAGYMLYNVIFVSDIPVTQPNVNHKKVNSLALVNDTLVNYWGDSMAVESGRLVLKEDRSNEKSNHIEIYFNRLKSKAAKPMPPIIFLAGGPGSSSTQIGKTKYFYLFKALSAYADVILLDQRGAGQSIPNLACRNSLATPTDITKNVRARILKDLIKKCKACADEFKAMEIDLASYNSYETALDIEALRKALNYDKITLYGYSYGTELAQIYIKYFEENVDRAILAGVLGPDHGLKYPKDAENQFIKMDSLIKLDKKLSKYIPDFLGMVKDVHKKLQAKPQFIQIPMRDAFSDDASFAEEVIAGTISIFKPNWNMILTDDHMQMMVSDNIGLDSWISKFPAFYYKISKEKYRGVGNMLRNFRRRRLPNALFFTVNAASRYSGERWQESIQQDRSSVISHFGLSYGRYPEVYNAFEIDKVEGMNEPVFGNTRLLLIGGKLDGRTPLHLSDDIAKRFPDNNRIKVENAGHNLLLNNEIKDGILLFLKDSLKADITVSRKIEFENPVPYKYSISDTITGALKRSGISEAIKLYENLYLKYNDVADYIFEFKPDPIYKIADSLIDNEAYYDAVTLLEYVIPKYPDSYFLYVYLSLAYQKKGDKINARINAHKVLALNFFDGNAHVILRNLENQ